MITGVCLDDQIFLIFHNGLIGVREAINAVHCFITLHNRLKITKQLQCLRKSWHYISYIIVYHSFLHYIATDDLWYTCHGFSMRLCMIGLGKTGL